MNTISNEEEIIDYIIDNFQSNYFDTIDFLKDNKKSLNREILKKIIVGLYFSYSYKITKTNLENYFSYFEVSRQEFDEIEKDTFIKDNQKLPSPKRFIDFLSNDKIDFTLKNNYITSQNIDEDYWYDLVIESIKFGNLNEISEYLLKHLKNVNFCFNNKVNFYNYVISGDNILIKKKTSEYIKYIKLFKRLGFDINNKDVTEMVPLYNAIRKKEKQMIVSIVKYKPKCDLFFENNHLWNIYLEKFRYDEYNYNVYQYFLKNVSVESLKTMVGEYYLAGRVLNKSNVGNATKELIEKCFSFYTDENSFGDKTIRERMINHPRIGKLFREEEMLYLENKMIKAMKNKSIGNSKSVRRRI